jgi:Family of unknown function (DUF6232)
VLGGTGVAKSEFITVRVVGRVLWVGSAAYPLQNIAGVQQVKFVPGRPKAVGRYVRRLLLCLILAAIGIAGTVIAQSLSNSSPPPSASVPDALTYAGTALVAAGLIAALICTIVFVVSISRSTHYGLVVSTAGSNIALVESPDQAAISGLVRQIVEAIENPEFVFHQDIRNYNYGDTYNVSGQGNVGRGSIVR